jgi:cysteine synthase A
MGRENHLLPTAVEAIGSTPIVELGRITRDFDGRIVAKLEFRIPAFQRKIELRAR